MIRSAALAGVLLILATSMSFACRGPAGSRACWANLKTMDGAIEMYNLDLNTRLFNGEARLLTPSDIKPLVDGGYLQFVPYDPGQGQVVNYVWVSDKEGVVCLVHGAPGGKTSARQQLEQLGVGNAALLRIALDTLPPDRLRVQISQDQLLTMIGLLFLLVEGFRQKVVRHWTWLRTVAATTALLSATMATAGNLGGCGHDDSLIPVAILALGLASSLVVLRALALSALRSGADYCSPRTARQGRLVSSLTIRSAS